MMRTRTRRTHRRNRYLQISIFFLIYSCYYAYSLSDGKNNTESTTSKVSADFGDLNTVTKVENVTFEYNAINTTQMTQVTQDKNLEATTEGRINNDTSDNKKSTNFWREKRNCTPPAIDQFPPTLIPPAIRNNGGVIIHVAVAIFTFLGLAIVCDEYFVSSLDRICEELQLSPDVAGATFMAAGSSAPELATVIIGVFFAKDDIGVSGVIGSAVFNIMFVISVCCLCSGTVVSLNWWPLVRDCIFYSFSILIMLIVIFNEVISWMEALFMLLCYVGYCVALKFNTQIERLATPFILQLPIKLPSREEQSSLVTFKNAPDSSYTKGIPNEMSPTSPQQELTQPDTSIYDPNSSWDPNAAWGNEGSSTTKPMNNGASSWSSNPGGYNDDWGDGTGQSYGAVDEIENKPVGVSTTTAVQNPNDYYKPKEARSDQPNPLIKPLNADLITTIQWHIVFPIHYMCRKTMKDVRQEEYKNLYVLTFIISMIWISIYSYIMVWMITIIGFTLRIPDTVMGLTFVAAGVSVPDALSSIAVIKDGYGDMAVSNAVGSNVFDILVCLGLPWFIQTAIILPGSHVNVISKGLAYSTLSLFTTVLFLLFAIHMNNWKLDKKLGFVLMFWYLFFIVLASLYELNVFGDMNPPECPSNY